MNENPDSVKPSSLIPYLIAVVVMVVVSIVAIIVVTVIRPTQDNSALYTLIVGLAAPTTLALLALMKAQETHLSVNSRLDQFITNAGRAERAEGELAGREQGKQEADKRTDELKK